MEKGLPVGVLAVAAERFFNGLIEPTNIQLMLRTESPITHFWQLATM
jgi:hypothetical protein